MIHYLKIRNFGPIKDEVEINFEVADSTDDAYEVKMSDGRKLMKLAYIYGANASGKTTVLKAFEFLRKLLLNPIGDKASELNFDPFLFCDGPYDISSLFELSFYVEDVRYIYEINFSKQSILNEKLLYYSSVKPAEIFTRETDMEKRLAKIQFGSKLKVPAREKDLLESNTLHNNTVLGAFSKTNVDIPQLEKLNKWFSDFLLGMITSEHDLTEITATMIDRNPAINDWINLFLNKADRQIAQVNVFDASNQISIASDETFPDEFTSRLSPGIPIRTSSIKKSQRKIDFIHKLNDDTNYSLSIQKESSGTKRYFGLGGPMYELIHHNHLLCIDELETSLHPDLMVYFLQVFLLNAKFSQLLITTHNLALLENQDFTRRDALWFSEKEKDGAVTLYSAADFDTSVLRKDASLINAYRSGRLGAKPNLGSPYLNEE